MKRRILTALVALGALTAASGSARAYNYPEIEWRSIETENFVIHFYDGTEQTAFRLAVIAEEQGPKVEAAFDFFPTEKTHIVVRDQEDKANGFAIFSADFVTIWSTNLYFRLRGRLDWLRNVFTHEYTHIISLKADQGWAEGVPGILFNGLAAYVFGENRYSIGYQMIVSGGNEPTWWSEGIAEWTTDVAGDNKWTANRDMLLRTSLMNGNELSLDEMSTINDKWGFDGERIYNSGYHLSSYIDQRFGRNKAMQLALANTESGRLEWNQSIEDLLEVDWEDLYNDWIVHLREKYDAMIDELGELHEGKLIVHLWSDVPPEERTDEDRADGSVNQYFPLISPDGSMLAFSKGGSIIGYHIDDETLGAYRDGDYSIEEMEYIQEGHTRAEWLAYQREGEAEEIDEDPQPAFVRSFSLPGNDEFDFSPDSQSIVWSSAEDEDAFFKFEGYARPDLFVGSLNPAEKEYADSVDDGGGVEIDDDNLVQRMLTTELRARAPVFSPDGEKIAFVQTRDGRERIGITPVHGAGQVDWVFDFHHDAQIASVQFSPDGKWLLFAMYYGGMQDLWRITVDGDNLHPITWGKYEERDPRYSRDGNRILFSADYNGIFNVYSLDLEDGKLTRITNTASGAFHPSEAPDGAVIYSHFTAYGFKIYRLDPKNFDNRNFKLPWAKLGWPINPHVVNATFRAERPDLQPISSRPYKWWRSLQPLTFVPTVRIDDDYYQVGLEMATQDYLNKHSFLARAEFGDATDLLAQYGNHSFTPDLYVTASHFNFGDSFLTDQFDRENTTANPPLFRERVGYTQETLSLAAYMQLTDNIRGSASYYLRRTEQSRDVFALFLGYDKGLLFGNSGKTAQLGLTYQETAGSKRSDASINPHDGRIVSLAVSFTDSKFFNSVPGINARKYSFVRGSFNWTEFVPVEDLLPFTDGWWHTLEFNLTAQAIDRPVSGFDVIYAGGELPLNLSRTVESNSQFAGYRRSSLTGETMMTANLNYRLPIARDFGYKIGWWYFSNVYLQMFGTAGNVWSFRPDGKREHPFRIKADAIRISNAGSDRLEIPFIASGDPAWGTGHSMLYDAGAEIRVDGEIFNRFNFDSFVRVAYGFQDIFYYYEDESGNVRKTAPRQEAGPLIYLGIGTGW